MIPSVARQGANSSERRLFTAFEGVPDRPDWVVFHSLIVRQHVDKLMGEADFVVVVPGKGIVVIEAKAPRSIDYANGIWNLDGVPSPGKNPLEQVDGAQRSIRSYLLRERVITGTEPIARLLWFTSIGRHQFGAHAPSDLTFFEWELAWADDLAQPALIIEKVLDEHVEWHRASKAVEHDPAGVTAAKADAITAALTRDFNVAADERDAQRELAAREGAVLAEQRFALELVEVNRAVYFDGPAGTGKSYLLAQGAIDALKRGGRTLLTCWNVVMADRLRESAKVVPGPVWVADLGSIMLRLAGREAHPADADPSWYQKELPREALKALAEHPERGGYKHLFVDEFQDMAGDSLLVQVLLALAAPDAQIMLAGDERQQIMRTAVERVDPFDVAKAQIPDLVRARIRRNCRLAPAVVARSEAIVGRSFGFSDHRLSRSTPGSASVIATRTGREAEMLADVLRLLTSQYRPSEVVVLSPWGSRSLAARVVNGSFQEPAHADDLRWLRANLGDASSRVSFGSVSKMKGIEASAVVVTDAIAWAEQHGLAWDDILYVALTRARFDAVVLKRVA